MSPAGASADNGPSLHPLLKEDRPHGWALPLLLITAGALMLGNLFDASVFKPAATALLAGLPLCVMLAFSGRDAVAAWFPATPGRLVLLIVALGIFAARDRLVPSGVIDSLLVFGLSQIAAVIGLRSAEHDPRALERSVLLVGGLVALACLAQALDIDLGLSGGPDEVVGLAGNSTRAGALLAMAVAAGVTALAGGRRERRGDEPHSERRTHYPLASLRAATPQCVLLVVLLSAWLLTRARGARLAALVALAAVGAAAWWRARHPAQTLRAQKVATAPARGRLLAVVLGLGVAALGITLALGGNEAVLGHKLADSGSLLDGEDLTVNVRFAVWSASADMIAAAPGGWGLGGFARHFAAFRDPLEAALPGLAGASTLVRHPHNELLLLGAEAGVLGALLGLLLVVLTARRAWQRCVNEANVTQRVAAAVFVAGAVASGLQDALHDVGTALPFWAAVGVIWSPRQHEARAWWLGKRSAGLLVAALGIALGLLAWPRLDSQLALRSAYLAVERDGVVESEALGFLERALQATPRDRSVAELVKGFAQLGMQHAAQSNDVPLQARCVELITTANETLVAH